MKLYNLNQYSETKRLLDRHRVIGCSFVAHPLSYTIVQLKYNISSNTIVCFVVWGFFICTRLHLLNQKLQTLKEHEEKGKT